MRRALDTAAIAEDLARPIDEEAAARAEADDILEGAEAIRIYLKLPSTRRVYFRREKGWPIGLVPGVGLSASKTELDRYRREQIAKSLKGGDA